MSSLKFLEKKIISVHGSIGAGKSTYIDHLQDTNENIQVFKEPIHLWQKYLDEFYKNHSVYTLLNLQDCILFTMNNMIMNIKNSNNSLIVIERSPMDSVLFLRTNRHLLSDDQYMHYFTLYHNLEKELARIGVRERIYIRNRNHIERVESRGDVIDEKYQKEINDLYEDQYRCCYVIFSKMIDNSEFKNIPFSN